MTIQELEEVIKELRQLLDTKFGENASKTESVLSCMVKLTEEVGELSEQIMLRRWRQRAHKWEYDTESAWKEIADVIIAAAMLAYELDIDVQYALEKKVVSLRKKLL